MTSAGFSPAGWANPAAPHVSAAAIAGNADAINLFMTVVKA